MKILKGEIMKFQTTSFKSRIQITTKLMKVFGYR